MKKNYKAQIALGIVLMILAFLITIQFRSVTKNNETQQQNNQRIEDLLSELNKERDKTEALEKQAAEYEASIAQYRSEAEKSSGNSNFLSEQLRRAELLAGLVCSISHITLQLTDGNGISLDTANTLGLTLALLWTYTATDSRKCGIFADHFICTGYIVLSHFLNESRNINIYRASLNTTWILTLQTACCLCHCLFFIISQTNLIEVCGTYLWILLSDRNSLHNIYFHIYPHFCMRFS